MPAFLSRSAVPAFLSRSAVPAFLSRFPIVSLDLVTDGRFVDIVAEGFDAGVRLGKAVPRDMVAVRSAATRAS